jgi:eukaryotic-like serine/threonine-protein kinase
MNFGRYELLTRLGRGGMGETWKARVVGAAGVSRLVVIKRVLANMATDERFTKAFIDEARITSTLTHGNIAQVVEFGEVNGEYFLAIEYVQGKTLELTMAQSSAMGHVRFPIAVACLIACELLEALDYAHTRTDESGQPLGIVHRDISPDNVLLGLDGQVKVVDFGVAKARLSGRPATEPGTLKGKWNFFSPEQARGEDVDARSDLFAVGIVLYRMLTGRLPFDGHLHQALFQIINGKFPPPGELAPDLPETLVKILLKALTGDRDQRYQSAHQMELELRAFMNQAGLTASAGTLREFLKELFKGEDPQADQRPTLDGPILPTATPHPSAPNPHAHEPTVVRSPSTRETVVDRLPLSPSGPQPEQAVLTEPSGPPVPVAAAVVSLPPLPIASPMHYPGPRDTANLRPSSAQRPPVQRVALSASTPAPRNNLWLELGLVLAIAAVLGGALIWWLSQR